MASLIDIGHIKQRYTSTGRPSGVQVAMHHRGLDETSHLSAQSVDILESKIHKLTQTWTDKWDKIEKDQKAIRLTQESGDSIKAVEILLQNSLDVRHAIDWRSLRDVRPYTKKKPGPPRPIEIEQAPVRDNFMNVPPLLVSLFGGKKANEKHARKQMQMYQDAMDGWKERSEEIELENLSAQRDHADSVASWEAKKRNHETAQAQHNQEIDDRESAYIEKNPQAVLDYCRTILNNSEYPPNFPMEHDLQYNQNNGMIVVDYRLPNIDDIPHRTIVKYIKARDEFEDRFLTQAKRNALFESVIYQIALRTLYELFEADAVNALTSATFNGIVVARNPATGHDETKCILSIQVNKDTFMEINLGSIDPKTCFKSLKGVSAAHLSNITPVQPILELDKSDKRFRNHYDVEVDQSTNLAAMAWEDFEHLVRELFEKEFVQSGGDVKVTQASSDGGVDAVAFDPDPIRGGKIVIQAKRYTNTVGVAAVRDLYGTVMNEGATKGILVTTADYGADSYEFARGKPLTLLNGSNLLHLLEKHGHSAKIDIKEARRLMKDA